jgi:phosphatidylserine decarboxylase
MLLKIKSALSSQSKIIEVIDRKTGEKFVEKVYGEEGMRVFYGNKFRANITSRILTNRFLSNVYGAFNDSAASKYKIEEFVHAMKIDISECEKDISEYQSFNEFFSRKLRAKSRPIESSSQSIVSPGDGRLLVFPKIDVTTVSYVKWAPIKLLDLFHGNNSLEERYKNGSCAVLRLCPSDYHRFHFPISGKAGVTKSIPGLLHSVNPYALEQDIPVFCLNKRTICELDSNDFGKVLLMEVGAMFVGSVVQTYRPGVDALKGEEKGYFKFGGSTCIFFFERDTMEFSQDIIQNSAAGIETFVHMGEQIGQLLQSKFAKTS